MKKWRVVSHPIPVGTWQAMLIKRSSNLFSTCVYKTIFINPCLQTRVYKTVVINPRSVNRDSGCGILMRNAG